MKPIKKYVKFQLDIFREQCNFTEEELQYFEMKAKDCSDIKIANVLMISEGKVAKLSKAVRAKMRIVIDSGQYSLD